MNAFFDPEPQPARIQPERTFIEQPGDLRSETRMTIQTRQAQKLVVGRKSSEHVEAIIGLLDFGRRMKLIWLSAEADDPFADWFLVKIEQSLADSQALIQAKTTWLTTRLDEIEGFDIQVAQSLQPLQVPIYFQNPFGYMGAYLIADYDALARSVFTARHIALIDRAVAEQLLQVTGKAIRRTFNLASQWKFTGVIRDDVLAQNPNALRAQGLLGECPGAIVAKTQRAKIAPVIKAKPKPSAVVVSNTSGLSGRENPDETQRGEPVATAISNELSSD
ncbi:TIGR03761 family integrating conjugative element protein [Methylicorpusculum oleiharenae]|uniref:PFL_4669 family integrating conjugative element protein n=1 Tax=Methylicorpusculum oleiharenae TaxID=1338687 RepID=UPI0013572392|nr:TIGR03761 family integrating conjugative element protein [Methylicorpusculum oleiharenae]MCD2452912.1 TIGR03761 family integrating conjugative element protein [Methylicorpusculum oleiharenae]